MLTGLDERREEGREGPDGLSGEEGKLRGKVLGGVFGGLLGPDDEVGWAGGGVAMAGVAGLCGGKSDNWRSLSRRKGTLIPESSF